MGVRERLSLQAVAEPSLMAAEHVHRYEFAASLCQDLRVLDLCCGSGYGCEIIAATAALVHGVDYDAATIDLATLTVGGSAGGGAISFELADATTFLRGDLAGHFDAIVCFEGLEHLPDVEATLAELRRHAAAGIAVIASVPNSRGLAEENEFHVSEFGYAEARAAFADFPGAVIVHQYLAEGSLIVLEAAGDLDARLLGLERAEPPYANHYILLTGVCAERAQEAHRSRMEVAIAPNHNRYMKSIEQANTELRRRNSQMLRNLLGKAGSAAPSYVKQTEARIAELTQRLGEIDELRVQVADRDRRIATLEELVEYERSELARVAALQPAPGRRR